MTYNSNFNIGKHSDNRKLLRSGISQQTVKVAERSFRSFLAGLKQVKAGEYPANKVKIPKLQEKK